jgi:type IV pilus assembly protein PilA
MTMTRSIALAISPQVAAISLCLAQVSACGSKEKSADDKSAKADAAEENELSTKQINEAKNLIGAISRGAMNAFERESVLPDAPPDAAIGHALCRSAKPVPAEVPSGGAKVEVPEDAWGGDATTGWKCLKFVSTNKLSFQLSYAAGGGYKGTDRGAKDPGPDGFQVCAEADGKPGGKTTLICNTGVVDKATQTVKIATEMQTLGE